MKPQPRFSIFLIVLLFTAAQSFAQIKDFPATLLWRIEGNGLKKPSYLYGTMHLTDRRLFYFGDSLYSSIENTEGLAIEVDLRSFALDLMNDALSKREQSKLLLTEIDSITLAPYKTLLEAKIKKPLADITVGDMKHYDDSLAYSTKEGDMPTAVDSYLYGMARNKRKWVGGIEDSEDQKDLGKPPLMLVKSVAADDTVLLTYREKMINLYLAQDLNGIEEFNQSGPDLYNVVRRNIKMAYRMDSLSHVRSCFFAVGAAHLPGDSGVINLLQKRGFRVQPVYSSARVEPDDSFIENIVADWHIESFADSLYSLEMPGETGVLGSLEAGMHSSGCIDIASETAYFTMNIQSVLGNQSADQVFDRMVENWEGATVYKRERLSVDSNVQAAEFWTFKGQEYSRVRAYILNSYLIINMVYAQDKRMLDTEVANRFFKSFALHRNPLPGHVAQGTLGTWENYRFPDHFFSVDIPLQYTPPQVIYSADSSWIIHSYEANDPANNFYYGISVHESAPGYYSAEDTSYFSAVAASLVERLNGEIISKENITFQGQTGRVFTIRQAEGLIARVKLIGCGNRRFNVFAICLGNDEEGNATKYLSSFRILPYVPADWSMQVAPDGCFTSFVPGKFREETAAMATGLPGKKLFSVYDVAGPATVSFLEEPLPAYLWGKSDTGLLRTISRNYIGRNDSVAHFRFFQTGNYPAADFEVLYRGQKPIVKRVRLILYGDSLFTVYSFLDPALLGEKVYQDLFERFSLTNQKLTGTYLENKTPLLLKDLQSKDSLVFERASDGLRKYEFTAQDLPLLHQALLQLYHDQGEYYSVYNRLISRIAKFSDPSSVKFVKKNLNKLKGDRGQLKFSLLSLLAKIHTTASYDLLGKLLADAKTSWGSPFGSGYLCDSLQLTASILPQLLPLAHKTYLMPVLIPVVNKLIDSSLLSIEAIKPQWDFYIQYATSVVDSVRIDNSEDWEFTDLTELLIRSGDAASMAIVDSLLRYGTPYLCFSTVHLLMDHSKPVNQEILEKLAADQYYRYELYSYLVSLDKEALFPRSYYTQQLIAESEVCYYATDEGDPDEISFIKEQTITYQGKEVTVFLFRVRFGEGDEAETYLGVAGPYVPGSKSIEIDTGLGGVFWQELLDEENITEQLNTYLEDR